MSSVSCDIDIEIPIDYALQNNKFVDNVLIYISGFMMKKLIDTEKCTYCYMYLTECKERVTCELINFKQLGGLKYPTFDVLAVVDISNRKMKLYFLKLWVNSKKLFTVGDLYLFHLQKGGFSTFLN